MSRRRNDPAKITAFNVEQIARSHRTRIADTAAHLNRRAVAARHVGLDSVTVQLPISDARLIADVLAEWARTQAGIEHDTVTATRRAGVDR